MFPLDLEAKYECPIIPEVAVLALFICCAFLLPSSYLMKHILHLKSCLTIFQPGSWSNKSYHPKKIFATSLRLIPSSLSFRLLGPTQSVRRYYSNHQTQSHETFWWAAYLQLLHNNRDMGFPFQSSKELPRSVPLCPEKWKKSHGYSLLPEKNTNF